MLIFLPFVFLLPLEAGGDKEEFVKSVIGEIAGKIIVDKHLFDEYKKVFSVVKGGSPFNDLLDPLETDDIISLIKNSAVDDIRNTKAHSAAIIDSLLGGLESRRVGADAGVKGSYFSRPGSSVDSVAGS